MEWCPGGGHDHPSLRGATACRSCHCHDSLRKQYIPEYGHYIGTCFRAMKSKWTHGCRINTTCHKLFQIIVSYGNIEHAFVFVFNTCICSMVHLFKKWWDTCVFVSYVYDVNTVHLYPFYVHFPDIQTPTLGGGMQSHSSNDNLWDHSKNSFVTAAR